MTASNVPLVIKQGATFTRGFTWHQPGPIVDGVRTPGEPYDLTGWRARLQIRRAQQATVQLEATTENGRIILGGATGRVTLNFPADATSAISIKKGLYDLELIDTQGNVIPLLEGAVEVTPNITQDTGEPVLK